jgi:hypothetical protein
MLHAECACPSENLGKRVHFPYIYRNLWGFGGFVCVTYNVRVQKCVVQDGICIETCTLMWCRVVLEPVCTHHRCILTYKCTCGGTVLKSVLKSHFEAGMTFFLAFSQFDWYQHMQLFIHLFTKSQKGNQTLLDASKPCLCSTNTMNPCTPAIISASKRSNLRNSSKRNEFSNKVKVHEIPHRSNYSKEEALNIWFTPEDWAHICTKNRKVC